LARPSHANFLLPDIGSFSGSSGGGETAIKELGDKMEAYITKKYESGELGITLRDITRLVLHDSLTLDPNEHTGGFTGSIRLPEELARPENAGLEPIVKKVEQLQKELETETGVKVSFADTEAFTGNMIAGSEFKKTFCSRVAPPCDTPFNAYGNKPKRMLLGRSDANEPSPAGRVPGEDASLDDFYKAFSRVKLGKKDICYMAPALFADEAKGEAFLRKDGYLNGVLDDIEKDKKQITQTNYQISFLQAYEVLVNRCLIDANKYKPTSA
jgi:L-ascorbate peroxidase